MIYNTYFEQQSTVSGITMVSCGHIFAKHGREINRPLGRNDWLIFFVAKGQETFYLPDEVKCDAGGFVLFAPNEAQHHCYFGSGVGEFYYIHFICDALPDNISIKTSKVYSIAPEQKICDNFEEIIDLAFKKQSFYERICIYKLLLILSNFESKITYNNSPVKENLDRIARVVQHINKYYNQNLTLEEYADMCNLSKYHFLRVFKDAVGTTPLEYRNAIRLKHAAEILADDNFSVEEVSEMTGFSSASYFSSAFKREFHISPKQYSKYLMSKQ